MAEMGNSCKAYYVSGLRKFSGWKENTSDLRGETKYVEGKEVFEPKTALEDDDILYLQENYVVTHGIFKDEHVVFDEINDDWKAFCSKELKFEIPEYALAQSDESDSTSSNGAAVASAAGADEASGGKSET